MSKTFTIKTPTHNKGRKNRENYTVKKTENSFSISTQNNWLLPIIFFFFWLPLIFLSIYGFVVSDYTIIETWGWFFIWLLFSIAWIWILKTEVKEKKAKKLSKNFKNTWFWIVKKVKITSIECYSSWNEHDWDCIYLEAKDWDIIYCSNTFKWGKILWWVPSLQWFEEIYKDYWFEYDENNKDDVLRAIDKRISEQGCIIQNEWFFKRIWAKMILSAAEAAKEYVERWYISPKLKINWHTVSIWDSVDVHIDPEDEKNYWMDIDFLFDK